MKVPESSTRRRDRAVIMARGLGARMGMPKGLLRLTDQGPTFLRIIADLYETAGLPVDVVVRPQDAEAYGAVLEDAPNARMVSTDGGGDTALTLLAPGDSGVGPPLRARMSGPIPWIFRW